jgi:DNA-binding NarL/FixJ family response regulator
LKQGLATFMSLDRPHASLDALKLRVLLAEGHRCVAEGFAGMLAPHVESVVAVHDGVSLVETALAGSIDLVIADVDLPFVSGLDALRHLRGRGENVCFIVMSASDDPHLAREAMCAGSNGYVLKQSPSKELYAVIIAVTQGHQYMSPRLIVDILGINAPAHKLSRRQQQVIDHIADGLRTAEIAAALDISPRTVESHRHALLDLFQVHNSVSLIREAERQGVIRLGEARRVARLSTNGALRASTASTMFLDWTH